MGYNYYWKDDNYVDFASKKRVIRDNRGVSGKYAKFSPEDMEVETQDEAWFPSVNKMNHQVSSYHCGYLDLERDLLNHGKRSSDSEEIIDRIVQETEY